MTEQKAFKRRVRERMSKTGESYTSARAQVSAKRDRNAAAKERLTVTETPVSDESVLKATGKTWEEWNALLDEWGATGHTHTEIATYVHDVLGVPDWWSQSVTVVYERTRGMRVKYQGPDGFSISASKTVAVPVGVLFEAFVDDVERKRWLPDGGLSLRTAQENRTARFDWEDGTTRVNVGFTGKGPSKSSVALAHERLADADHAETMKAMWKERLADLKTLLES
jgi:uncharacterized protein YndB with AHSA1/START domain